MHLKWYTMKITNVKGWWSTNIGNSLFQLSSQEILKELGFTVIEVPDMPGFMNVRKGNPENFFDFMNYLDVDYHCIHGPFLRKEFDKIYLKQLKSLKSRGVKLIGLGVGCMDYSYSNYYKKWMNEVGFDIITTRDRDTLNILSDVKTNLYDGLDLGFFISTYNKQPKLNKDFVCFNFDQILEPNFYEDSNGPIRIGNSNFSYKKRLSSEPRGMLKKIFPFVRPYFKAFKRSKIEGYEIIRLDHRFNPYSRKKIYSDKNTFAMDVPGGYLIAYANSKLTLSNRVHACVAREY